MCFNGEKGETVVEGEVPAELKDLVEEKRAELIEKLADADDEIGEFFLMEETPDIETLKAAIRRTTLSCTFVPVFMGSAFKNKGVQPLLDGVIDYLPEPHEKENFALDRTKDEEPVPVTAKQGRSAVGTGIQARRDSVWSAHLHAYLSRNAQKGKPNYQCQ